MHAVWTNAQILNEYYLIVMLTYISNNCYKNKLLTNSNSVALVPERTIPTERPPLVGVVSAKFCG
jgi:hypothetical protein